MAHSKKQDEKKKKRRNVLLVIGFVILVVYVLYSAIEEVTLPTEFEINDQDYYSCAEKICQEKEYDFLYNIVLANKGGKREYVRITCTGIKETQYLMEKLDFYVDKFIKKCETEYDPNTVFHTSNSDGHNRDRLWDNPQKISRKKQAV